MKRPPPISDALFTLIAVHMANPYRRRSPKKDRELREFWWQHSQPGNRFPAERGLILIDGDRS